MATILVVDDRPTNRQFLSALLGYGGHRLLEAADGAEALRLVRTEHPDLVISDILMPTMDGFEFAKNVRAEPGISDTKIVFYTATYRSQEALMLAKACGVSKVIAKPAEPQEVLDAVNEQLGISGASAIPRSSARRPPELEAPGVGRELAGQLKDLHELQVDLEAEVEKRVTREVARERERLRGISTKFAKSVAQLHDTSTRLSTLIELGMAVAAAREPRRMLELFVVAARKLLRAHSAVVLSLNTAEDRLQHVASDGLDAAAARAMAAARPDDGLVAEVLAAGKVVRKAAARGSLEGLPEGHPSAGSFLGVRLGTRTACLGVAFFAGREGEAEFTAEDGQIAEALAAQLAVAYENFDLFDTLQRRAAELQVEVGERERAQAALAESERGLHRAQVMAKLGHVITDPDGAFESWSEILPQLAGIDPAAMPRSTREWLDRLHPEDRERFRARSIEAAATGQRAQIEYRLRRAENDWIDIRQFIEPLPAQADAKERSRWFSTLQDVTEHKRAEEELRAGRQLLDNIVDNIPTSVQLKSVPEFRVLLWNKAAEAMYGVPREEAIGRNVHDLWPQEDADRFHAADLELIASGHLQDFPDRPAQTRARGEIRVHMRKVALFDAAGKATHVLAIADDITSRLADQARLRESEERFRSLSMLSSDWFWEQDEQHRFVKFSGGEGVKGWGPDQSKAIGLHRWDLGGVIPISCSWEEHKGLLDAHKPFRNFEYQRILGDGRLQYVEASGEPIFDAAGRFTGYRGVATEITQRKAAEAKIKRLNRVYAVLSGINTLIVRARDRDSLFNEACRIAVKDGQFRLAWIGLVDHESERVKPVASDGDVRGFFDASLLAKAPKRKAKGKGMAWQALKEKRPVISNDVQADPQTSMKSECKERGVNSLVMLPLVVGGDAIGVLALYAAETGFFDDEEMRLLVELAGDISFALDHLQKAEKLNYLAYYDELTGLANRTLFHERLSQHVSAAGAGKVYVAVVILDIERFKTINDTLGRQAGDALLAQVAGRMKQHSDDPARLARISADHFAVVVPGVQSEEEFARRAEQRMHQYFDEPFRVGDSELRVAARAGVAMYPDDGADAETLFRNAEAALKKAKASGDKILFYTQQMTERVAGKLALENKLRQALEKDEFLLHYQPKVEVETRRIVGVEALIRWQSPERGLVPPAQFIPLLEETGLIRPVGSWALKRASLDHRAWVEQGLKPPRVAVNVSAIQLRQRDFVDVVKDAIAGGVSPTGIDLEITESLIMEDVKGSIEKLKAVCALGLKIAIDDFGTGYSSLGYLAQLPVQALKIDRSFIIRMHDDPNAMTLVSTIISLAHSLHLQVVAEGVETEDQAKFLRLLRCDEMQGYLFSKPVPEAALVELLRKAVP